MPAAAAAAVSSWSNTSMGVAKVRMARCQLAKVRMDHVQRIRPVELAVLVPAAALLLSGLPTTRPKPVDLLTVPVA